MAVESLIVAVPRMVSLTEPGGSVFILIRSLSVIVLLPSLHVRSLTDLFQILTAVTLP